jgi:HPt (histidine-containing phosphotransfer) domain-containing protein/CheY-like chemotaxis protein
MTDHSLSKLLEQERIAHKAVRENLEKKNQELFLINEQLKEANKNLEELVQRRTEEIKSIGLWLYTDITLRKHADDIVALTATAVNSEQEKSFQDRMKDLLAKQFEEDELIQFIAKWIGNESILKSIEKRNIAIDKPLYDLSNLYRISGGNEQFIKKMLRVFNGESVAAVQQIKEAYSNNNVEKIKTIAHRVKPSVQNMGIHSLTENILQLESFDITINSKEFLLSLINKLDEVINKVVMQLNENVLK